MELEKKSSLIVYFVLTIIFSFSVYSNSLFFSILWDTEKETLFNWRGLEGIVFLAKSLLDLVGLTICASNLVKNLPQRILIKNNKQ